MKYKWLSLAVVSGLIALAPYAKADEWNKRTIVTFNEPVEIPGHVLPAGTYVMKLADSPSDRTIVQVFNKDESKIIDTVMAIPDYREEPTGKTVITFEERAGNSPEAVKAWFYPGDLYGEEFVYPNESPKTMIASNQPVHHPAYSATPAPESKAQTKPAPVTPAPAATPAPAPQPTQMAMAKPEPTPAAAPTPAPAPAPQQQTKPANKTLPKTASDVPLIALLGGFAAFTGLAIRKLTA